MRDADGTGATPTPWAAFLRELTNRDGWSVARLARESGIHRSSIFRWMNGEVQTVTVDYVQRIARAAGVDEAAALRAAGNNLEPELPPEDEESIRLIRESDAPEHVKEELVREIRRMQRQHAQERASIAERVTRPT